MSETDCRQSLAGAEMKDLCFLVIGDRCWGKGVTETAARSAARKEGGRKGLDKAHLVYLATKGSSVDDVGNLAWPADDFRPVLIKYVKGGVELPPDQWPGKG